VVPRLLVIAQWRARRRRQLVLALAFGTGLLVFLGLTAFLAGAQDSVEAPIRATTTGAMRVTDGNTEMAGGEAWPDARPAAAALADKSGGHVSLRWESSQLTVRRDDVEAWSGGVLLGIDPRDATEGRALAPYLAWGSTLEDDVVFHPGTGRALVPVLVGDKAAKRLNLTLGQDGAPDFDAVLLLTSGRLREPGGLELPITKDAVVVGVFDTGLEPFDRFAAFVPLQAARELAGHGPADPTANALVLRGGDAAAGAAWARGEGYRTEDAARFARGFMGGVVVVLDAAAKAAAVLLGLVLLTWLGQETAAAVRADLAVLASLRAVGLPLASVSGTYGVVAGASVMAGATVAGLLAALLPLVPGVHLEASGIDADIALAVPSWAWAALPVAVLAAAGLATAAAARRLARSSILDALRS